MNSRITAAPLTDEAHDINFDGSATLCLGYSEITCQAKLQKFAKSWAIQGYEKVTLEECVAGKWVKRSSYTLSF